MTPKQPTPSGISRLLSGAGFERSKSSKSRIKGWTEWSAGYKVSAGDRDGEVIVEHRVSSLRIRSASRFDEEGAKLGEYSDAIGARYDVAREHERLIVTAKTEEA